MFDVSAGNFKVNYETFVFPGGEVSVKLNEESIARVFNLCRPSQIFIIGNITNSNELIELCLLTDALRRISDAKIDLVCKYFPYARQDRVMVKGEALSVKVIANIINGLNFNKVTIWDAHSEVTPALLNNCVNLDQASLIKEIFDTKYEKLKNCVLVAPDAGALKKIYKVANALHLPLIRADKLRDVSTGKILETIVYDDKVETKDKDFLIVDDICDGGRTFIELAKVLMRTSSKKIYLYVTHGIFSNGFTSLDDYFDEIFCPNIFPAAKEQFDSFYGRR